LKNTCRIISFFFILCGYSVAATLEEEIGGYLASLAEVRTVEQIDAIIEQAKKHLDANRAGSSEVTRGFIQGDIQQARGRACVNLWLRDKTDESTRRTARESLLSSIGTYGRYADQADEDADKLAKGLRGSVQRSSRWRNFAGYGSRANYSRAWSHHALGLLENPGQDKDDQLAQAMDFFEPFISGGYRDNRIVQDCFLGYALCLFEQDRIAEAGDLVNERRIRPDNTSPDVFKQMTLLRIRIHEKVNSPLSIELASRLYFQSRPDDAGDYDPAEQQILLKRIEALATLAAGNNPYTADFRSQLSACRKQLARQAPQYNPAVTQMLHTAGVQTALGSLQKAKTAYDTGRFQQALDMTEDGLDIVDPALESDTVVDLQYLQCLCLNKLNKYEQVIRQVKAFLDDYPQDPRVSMLSQIGMEAVIAAAKAGQVAVSGTFDQFATVYAADEDHAPDMLTWYRAGFDAARGRFAQAESRLDGIGADSPVALRCYYLKSFAAYQQSRQDGGNLQALTRAMDAAIAFGSAADESAEDWVCVGVFDLIIAMMADCVNADLSMVEPMAIVETAEKLLCLDDERKERLLIASAVYYAKYEEFDKLRDILSQVKKGPCQEKLADALLAAAELLTAEDAQSEKTLLGADIFKVVLETGKDAEGRNRSVILWKLAESLRRAGRYELAVKRYQEILDADAPRVQIRVVRGLAITFQVMQDYEKAAKQWQQLTRLITPTIPGWYEAHYELIHCRQLTGDTEKAAQLLAYFRLKYPEPLPAEWADKFAAMEGGTP
jgi:tetratricopeptide (TPR) repeat protein